MATTNEDDYPDKDRTHSGFFHRSLSPCSFERLRAEHSDYFYQPKRGPSASKSNITITRPIKTFETVTKLVELLSQGHTPNKIHTLEPNQSPTLSKNSDDQRYSSHYSSFLSMDGGDLSPVHSSTFSSRSNSSISTVPEHESQVIIIEEPIISAEKLTNLLSSWHIPAIGINITNTNLHLVLLELYPQNVDYSTIIFQRYLISLMEMNEHRNWSISNIGLPTTSEQEGNFRLFTLTNDEFNLILIQLQTFIHSNSSLASSFVLNIALTGEQTNEYERKISLYLNKINLNFDIIQFRAESFMIGLEFFLGKNQIIDNHEEFIQILDNQRIIKENDSLYPYLLIHAEVGSTFFYIVHSSSKYSVLISNNLCYKTYLNLMKLLQPGYESKHEEQIPSSSIPIRRPSPMSFDCTRQDLCKNCHRSSTIFPSQVPLTSFTRIPQRYFPSDYSQSKTSHYIYRGWSNQRISSSDKNTTSYDVHTQTDDSFLEFSSLQTRLAMHRSLLSMFTMNLALLIKLLLKIYPSIDHCILTGEFFQLEKQAAEDLTIFIQSIIGHNTPRIYQLKRELLIAALGCVLPRVYFDVIDDERILGNDCIN